MLSSESDPARPASANIALASLFDYTGWKLTELIQLISLCYPQLSSKFNTGVCVFPLYHVQSNIFLWERLHCPLQVSLFLESMLIAAPW